MSIGSPLIPSRELLNGIEPFRRRVLQLDVGSVVLVAVTAVVIYLITLMWLDTIIDLPASVRWGTSRIGLLAALLTLTLAVLWRAKRITPDRIADQIDHSIGSGGQVLAGLQLTAKPIQPAGPLSEGFAAIAAQKTALLLKSLQPDVVGTWNKLKQPGVSLAGVLTVVVGLALITPGIAWHQFQRFMFPSRDLPQYTGVDITLELEHSEVLYGQDVMVYASVANGQLDRMSLVALTDQNEEHVLPMLAQDESRWQAILTRVTEPLTLYARSGNSRSLKQRLDVQMTPQILPVKVTITPPAYTHMSVYRGLLPDQGLVGVAGTTVRWDVSSNRPLAAGLMSVNYANGEQESIELKPIESESESYHVEGTYTLTRSGQFELSVTDISGIKSHSSIGGTIRILDDRRPIVRIVQPQQQSLATPDVKLPVTVAAEDDFGISRLTLYRSLNGSPASPVDATFEEAARVEGKWELPLMSFGLEPGDEIQLFARTEDNDPAGAKGAESPVTIIRIISVQQFQEMMLQRRGAETIQAKYQAARRHFDQLSSALKKVQEAQAALEQSPDSEEAKQRLQEAMQNAQQVAEQATAETKKLSDQPLPVDVDRELAKRLEAMSDQARKMAERLQDMKQNAKPQLSQEDQKALSEMISQTSENQQKLTENAIDPLNTMQQMLPLMIDQQQFTQLVQQQRDLATRLDSLREIKDSDPTIQRRIAELESEQEQLKQRLDQLLSDIERHAQELTPNEDTQKLIDTALKFVNDVRDSQAMSEMAAGQESLLDSKFASAQEHAAKAAEILESFLNDCNGMQGQACENCKAAFKPNAGGCKLGNSIQQMLSMMGMKPGSSGMKPGMGAGMGAGGGYSQRFAGPENIGMYGSLPTPSTRPSRGQSNQQAQGFQTSSMIDSNAAGNGSSESRSSGEASGQAMNSVPTKYRSQVAEYFRNVSESIGSQPAAEAGNSK